MNYAGKMGGLQLSSLLAMPMTRPMHTNSVSERQKSNKSSCFEQFRIDTHFRRVIRYLWNANRAHWIINKNASSNEANDPRWQSKMRWDKDLSKTLLVSKS